MNDNQRPIHLDLFSGLGGFALAAQWAGFETVAFCESDTRCRTFLERTWGLPVEPDIRTLDGRKYRGVTLLTGGPPCQPASRAGNQRGAEDDRWLWDEALRVLAEAEPDSVVFENPPGILDVGIDGILSEMGRLGYETQCFDIPACAVGSPQLRHRIWIVGFMGHSKNGSRPVLQREERREDSNTRRTTLQCDYLADAAKPGREGTDPERRPDGCAAERGQGHVANSTGTRPDRAERKEQHVQRGAPLPARSGDSDSDVANAESERRLRWTATSRQAQGWQSQSAVDGLLPDSLAHSEKQHRPVNGCEASECGRSGWSNFVWVPGADGKVRRAPDDSFSVVDGLHRSLLGALGNSIVPQVAFEILKAMRQYL